MSDQRSQCISFTDKGERCDNHTLGNSKHCEDHWTKCSKLYNEYKAFCNQATNMGECILESADSLTIDEIKKYLNYFMIVYAKHRNCYKQRNLFSNTCVYSECRDQGHEYKIKEELRITKTCESVLQTLRERLQYLQNEAEKELKNIMETRLKSEDIKKMIEEDKKVEEKKKKKKNTKKKNTKKENLEEEKLFSSLEKQNKEINERIKIDRMRAFNYFYTIIFKDKGVKFNQFENMTSKQVEEIDNENNQHMIDIIKEKRCRPLLLRIQQIILNINRKLTEYVKHDVENTINKYYQDSYLSKEQINTILQEHYVKNLQNAKSNVMKYEWLSNFDKKVINYRKDDYQSLLSLADINKTCDPTVIINHIIYCCQYMYSILLSVPILDYKKKALFNSLQNNAYYENNAIYILAKVNDSLDSTEKFIYIDIDI